MLKFLGFLGLLCFIISCSQSNTDGNLNGGQNMKRLDSTNEFSSSEKKGVVIGNRITEEVLEKKGKAFSGEISVKR